MDIDVWLSRDVAPVSMPTTAAIAARGSTDLASLAAAVATCTRCDLHLGRTQTVFGVGDPNADWLIIGEAPGAEEDRTGEPFVGRAGALLNAMMQAMTKTMAGT